MDRCFDGYDVSDCCARRGRSVAYPEALLVGDLHFQAALRQVKFNSLVTDGDVLQTAEERIAAPQGDRIPAHLPAARAQLLDDISEEPNELTILLGPGQKLQKRHREYRDARRAVGAFLFKRRDPLGNETWPPKARSGVHPSCALSS